MSDTQTTTTELLESFDNGVLTLTMNRPERRNALTVSMASAMNAALIRAANDSAVRAVVLTGAGEAFCAGGDVKNMAAQDRPPNVEERTQSLIHRAEAPRLLATMAKPTIAVIRGAAAGAGLSLALACDFRIASESSRLTTAFAKVGLSGDYGGAYFLTRLVGAPKALELFMMSPVLTTSEASTLGMLTRVFPDANFDADAKAFVRALADGPSVALGNIKRNVNLASTASMDASFESEAVNQVRCMATDDHREAARSFVEKRKPVFKGQ